MLSPEQQIFEQIKKANNILITFNKIYNGDSVASALAFFLFLKKLDKNVDLVAEKVNHEKFILQSQNEQFSFLPAHNEIKNSLENLRKFIISLDISKADVKKIKYQIEKNLLNFIISPKNGFFTHDNITSRSGGFKYDLIIVLDTPDLESIGAIYDKDTEFFYQVPIINIDHHSNNEEFGQINYCQLTAIATSEILFTLLDNYSRELIDEDIATCLLTGMIAKTQNFKTQNITPGSLTTAAQLISIGARREDVVNRLYRSHSLNVLKLWGRVLARLNSSLNNKLVWSTLTSSDFVKTGSNENNLVNVIDELIINIPQARIILIFYEEQINQARLNQEKNELKNISQEQSSLTKVLLFSVKNIDLHNLIKEYNLQGNKKLASLIINKPIQEAEKEIIEHIEKKLTQLPI